MLCMNNSEKGVVSGISCLKWEISLDENYELIGRKIKKIGR